MVTSKGYDFMRVTIKEDKISFVEKIKRISALVLAGLIAIAAFGVFITVLGIPVAFGMLAVSYVLIDYGLNRSFPLDCPNCDSHVKGFPKRGRKCPKCKIPIIVEVESAD